MNQFRPFIRLIPNLLTASRGVAGPVVFWLMLVAGEPWVAFWVFAAAAFTDLFDGWLARTIGGGGTELGAWLDPASDKCLVGFTWLALLCVGWAPWWLVVPMLIRNVLVGVLWWIVTDENGERFEPSGWGQVMASFEGTSLGILMFHGPWGLVHWPSVGVWVGLISLALSLVSALGYARSMMFPKPGVQNPARPV